MGINGGEMKHEWKSLGHGIYRDSRTDALYHRPKIAGKRSWRKLTATTLTKAKTEMALLQTRQLESKMGIPGVLDPYAELLTIGPLAKAWLDQLCPDRHGRARMGSALQTEKARLVRLLPFWRDREARAITGEDCQDYHAWRLRQLKRQNVTLARSVDLELTTLSNLFAWATQNPRKTGLNVNPLQSRRKFVDQRDIRHCTAVMPLSDEIFHRVAAYLLTDARSRPLGWQFLLEGLTGARTSEILACRIDATAPRQPGYQDATALHLHRAKKGIEPWALLEVVPGHAPLRDCLTAFRCWHAQAHAETKSPWFIPGRDPTKPAIVTSLTHALARASAKLGLPRITSHGLRAYFVRVSRSMGIDDSEISKRLGQRSGVMLVEKTYGTTEPGWFGARRMDFLPGGSGSENVTAAWLPWMPDAKKVIELSGYTQRYTDETKKTANTNNNQ